MENTSIAPLLTEMFQTLTADDLEWLAKSYISPELAAKAELHRVDSMSGAEIVGRTPKASADYAGIIFPYRWPGGNRAREFRLRRDHPDLELQSDGKTKEKAKYLSPPGRGNLLYFPPDTEASTFTETSISAVITEGEKKALALSRFFNEVDETRLVIGLSGVWNWRGTVGNELGGDGKRYPVKGVIPDFDQIEWKGRTVEIVFDANVKSKPEVAAARRELAKEFVHRGASVRVVDLPDDIEGVNGVDDLLFLKGAEFVQEMFETARLSALKRQVKTMAGNIVFTVDDKGVFATDVEQGDRTWVCSPLYIEADTRDGNGDNWGRLLRFFDADGREHKWAMPMSLLSGDGKLYREKLLDSGLILSPVSKARNLLDFYLSTKPKEKVRCVNKIGWQGEAYIFPDDTVGSADGEEIYLQAQETNPLLRVSGDEQEWRDHIGHYCIGNSRLVFAVSLAFASSLLNLVGEEGGGIHFRGETTEGKTTALYVAGSVWGGGSEKGFLKRWKATGNGLEHVAACHNDSLLCLDEIAECDPREVGSIAYMLANGQGKIRSHRGLGNRPLTEWRLLFLSSGEIRLSDLMIQAGQRIKGGQEVRFVNVEANAGCGFGLFEDVHDFKGGAAFSKHLVECSKRYYGAPIRRFIKDLISDLSRVRREAKTFMKNFITSHVPEGVSSEVGRVSNRFALAAYAGELASSQGITGWNEGESTQAAAKLFAEWLGDRGTTGSSDEEKAVRQVRAFLEAHGASRFQSRDEQIIHNRVGFKVVNDDGQIEFLIQKEQFMREVCAGLDAEMTARALFSRKYLTRQKSRTKGFISYRRVPDSTKLVSVYVITSAIFDEITGDNGDNGDNTPNN
ncbi:MAG TPA: DUF927 domain-containing protein [Blastocatellia bacterium]